MPKPEFKVCAECEHCWSGYVMYTTEHRCFRPIGSHLSVVVGEVTERVRAPCRDERKAGRTFWKRRERCGPSGKFWEKRRPMTPPTGGSRAMKSGGSRD